MAAAFCASADHQAALIKCLDLTGFSIHDLELIEPALFDTMLPDLHKERALSSREGLYASVLLKKLRSIPRSEWAPAAPALFAAEIQPLRLPSPASAAVSQSPSPSSRSVSVNEELPPPYQDPPSVPRPKPSPPRPKASAVAGRRMPFKIVSNRSDSESSSCCESPLSVGQPSSLPRPSAVYPSFASVAQAGHPGSSDAPADRAGPVRLDEEDDWSEIGRASLFERKTEPCEYGCKCEAGRLGHCPRGHNYQQRRVFSQMESKGPSVKTKACDPTKCRKKAADCAYAHGERDGWCLCCGQCGHLIGSCKLAAAQAAKVAKKKR